MIRKTLTKIVSNPNFAVLAAFVLMALSPLDGIQAFALAVSGGGFSFSMGGGGGGGGIGEALCTVVGWITEEGAGQAIASLAVIFLGVQAFFGKVNWGTALMYVAGIFAIFGSQEIVDAITGGLGGGGGCM